MDLPSKEKVEETRSNTSLLVLNGHEPPLTCLVPHIAGYCNLTYLDIGYNHLADLPKELSQVWPTFISDAALVTPLVSFVSCQTKRYCRSVTNP